MPDGPAEKPTSRGRSPSELRDEERKVASTGPETAASGSRRGPPHHDELTRLRRIEGQVRGIQGMVEADRYCIDILTQIRSVLGALEKVSDAILERHLRHCVADAFSSDDPRAKEEKLQEVLQVLEKARR